MMNNAKGIQLVTDEELRLVRGGRSIWGWIKKGAKWAKDHVVGGFKWVGLKFGF